MIMIELMRSLELKDAYLTAKECLLTVYLWSRASRHMKTYTWLWVGPLLIWIQDLFSCYHG